MSTHRRPDLDPQPPTPGGTSARPWHSLFPDGCRHCGSAEYPHEGRGLCKPCYMGLRAAGNLWRYPGLTNYDTGTKRSAHHRRHAIAWDRLYALTEHVGPFIAADTCQEFATVQPRYIYSARAEPSRAKLEPATLTDAATPARAA